MTAQAVAQSPTKPRHGSSRVASIDSARGAAMLFVCLAHFANAYHFRSGADTSGMYLVIIGMIASPTFVTVSGMVAGFLSVTRAASFRSLQQKLVDRGLFLLIVGHTILAASGIFAGRSFAHAFRIGYITDVVGFAVVFGPWLVTALKPRARLAVAAIVFAASWVAVFFWEPSGSLATALKHYFVGTVSLGDSTRGDFTILPWFAVYIVGTVIGESVARYYSQKRDQAGHLMLAKLGAICLSIGLAAKLALHLVREYAPTLEPEHPMLLFSISSYQKFPPGPVYLLCFGGIGLLLVSAILETGRRGLQPFLMNQLRQIGMASLFIYVLQFYLYAVVLSALRLPYSPLWPLIFLLSVVILVRAAAAWNAREGNRFLTVGVGRLLKWNETRRAPSVSKPIGLDASVS